MHGPVYLCDDIRRIERAAGDTQRPLMERAGTAAAEVAAALGGDSGKDVLVLAGPGNNALGTARRRPLRHRPDARHHRWACCAG